MTMLKSTEITAPDKAAKGGQNGYYNAMKAEVLARALPNIQLYRKKIIVVKYGGNAMINEELKESVMRDLVLLTTIGIKVVLVHGGGPEINKALKAMNIESKFENGLRVTDKDTVNVVQMVLAGKVNKDLVCQIGNLGGHAIGLSGMDDNMIKCRPLDESHGFVGDIIDMNTEVIDEALNNNFIPVIPPSAATKTIIATTLTQTPLPPPLPESLKRKRLFR